MVDTGKTVKVLGKEYPVQLRETTGLHALMFHVDLGDGQELEDASFLGLWEKARDFKDVRFDLPFTNRYGVNGSITGFHAGNDSLLIRWESGATGQERRLDDAMPRLSEAEYAELRRLVQASNDAKAAWDAFVSERKFGNSREAANAARIEKAGLA